MGQRLDLHTLLLGIPGVADAYFQPPETQQLQYPCIIYKWDDESTEYADNLPYARTRRYQIKIIDRDPDTEIPKAVGDLPMSSFDRFYTADNLNHYVFNLYF